MKLSSVLALTAAVVGITACAAGSPDEGQSENTGSTQQAMCLNYPNCLTKTRTWGGLTSSSGDLVVYDPVTTSSSSSGGTTTGLDSGDSFTCTGTLQECQLPGHTVYLVCDTNNPQNCMCNRCDIIPNGLNFGTYNPCMYGLTYRCTTYGTCTCS